MKNEQVKVKCIGIDDEGRGIAKIDGQDVYVPYLLPGETAVVEAYRKKNFIDAEIVQIKEKSSIRVQPKCRYFGICGGCKLQHLSYEAQSDFKQAKVENLMKHYCKVNKILTMSDPYYYRNKVHAAISADRNGKIISGIYEENTHKIIQAKSCMIEDKHSHDIMESVVQTAKACKIRPYNEDTGYGFLRHVLVKRAFATNQIMVVLVTGSKMFTGKNNFIKSLLKAHPEITTVVMNVNDKKTSAVFGNYEKVLFGKGYIEDILCGCKFQISSKSFYQINPLQTEVLYNKAIEMASLKKSETVLDAYCGIGTISLIVSRKVKSVAGVELNKDSVHDAIKNAKLNKITNAYFYNADAGEFMDEMAKEKQKVDVVFMDPPRSGSEEKFLSSIAKLLPKKVIYISCNPETQERDLKYLTKHGYKVEKVQPVDMFPMTGHVECIAMMSRVKK